MKNEACGFRCTGYEGKEVWKKLHQLPKEIDCEECSGHADMLFRGIHDHVNAGLGKEIYDEENYRKFVDEVMCTCKKRGFC